MSKRRAKFHLPEPDEESAFQFTMARVMQLVGIPVIAFLAWSMWTAQSDMQEKLGEIKTAVALLQDQMKTRGQDEYKGVQARADLAVRDARISDHEARLDYLERELAAQKALRGSSQ